MIRIIRVSLFVASNSVVSRGLVQAYGKINEAVGENNRIDDSGRKKGLVFPFRRQELWKFIRCIILAVAYGKKEQNIWKETLIFFGKNSRTKLHRYVRGNTYLHKGCCDLYFHCYCYACHLIILSYKTSFISWMLL